ncbi:hypothetical protein [Nocardia asteroides]|uniref:hypothetical protein n=1 Tax=Nocardia asteroides TaxID=1824 RepID=UPI001E5F242D|nr:hypothetical protein [Nocardia asteroides]UGT61695.1 hypothetical protein LTT61_32090 [Nocardia asteroides]
MSTTRAVPLTEQPDPRVTAGVARWEAAHRAALAAGDPHRAEATRAVLDGYLSEARRRSL